MPLTEVDIMWLFTVPGAKLAIKVSVALAGMNNSYKTIDTLRKCDPIILAFFSPAVHRANRSLGTEKQSSEPFLSNTLGICNCLRGWHLFQTRTSSPKPSL